MEIVQLALALEPMAVRFASGDLYFTLQPYDEHQDRPECHVGCA